MKATPKQRRLWIGEVVLLNALLFISPLLIIGWAREVVLQFPGESRSETLSMIGLILAGSLAGNFSVSYNGTKLSNVYQRYFAHGTKYALQLSIVLNLIFAVSAVPAEFYVDGLAAVALLLYVAIMMHNIWDVLRACDEYHL